MVIIIDVSREWHGHLAMEFSRSFRGNLKTVTGGLIPVVVVVVVELSQKVSLRSRISHLELG